MSQPVLRGVWPQSVDTVYFDTASHDLAAHRVSLRRCTGGGNAGWQLTLPAGPNADTHTRIPLKGDDESVPDALRDTVLAIVRDRPLVPVAPAGTGHRVSKQAVRKLDSAHRAVSEQIEKLLEWDRAVRVDAPDGVHQMRVTIRTIRSLLQASPAAFGLANDASLLEELRELATVLGMARDAEVLADRYQRALDELPAKLIRGPIRDRLIDGAHDRYRTGLRASVTAMRSSRYFRLLDALDSLTGIQSSAAATPVTPSAAKNIADGYERIRKRVNAAATADAEHHDVMLHRIRKSAKRLRYIAAAGGATKVSDAAKVIQTLLGDHQDSVVSRANLAEQVEAANAAGEDTFTYGLLYQQETDLAHDCERELPAALKSLKRAVHTVV
ncbi:CYTH and CHAD domain-containing protein [Mycolicibacterium aubagnense]|uniref:CHAD domain-containing protein n=1 Tax=Mycolicibacterium aubagnense TaxID=319707 RepID=A0ABN5YPN3_9MYCO|nr:CYTH and CHAD domain-containing protein [Mycolicibacterium aubagnense]TLH61252.1 CHAD domain-containing protein [Mycolicibacterium aubagnense]WGI35114.1 CYTH and CHAD domain-containing protein [Mycolicibacterium aubagnense]BBX82942.1 hypothetical protein MAUB_08150 [Mycolicibacterium aubagnense]